MSPPVLTLRDAPPRVAWALEQAGVHPLLARLYAARGVRTPTSSTTASRACCRRRPARRATRAARLLADTIRGPAHLRRRRLRLRRRHRLRRRAARLALLGAAPGTLAYVVPDRAVHGYGLTPAIVDLALDKQPRCC
jgi:single-stranded-DNA-specific exonuclease